MEDHCVGQLGAVHDTVMVPIGTLPMQSLAHFIISLVASFQDIQPCPPWPRGRPRAVVAYGAVSKMRGTLRPHVGCKAHEHCVLCSCTPEIDKPPQPASSPHIARG